MCPPMRAHWRHLANTIELVLPSATTQTANRSVHHFCTDHGRVSSGRLAPPGKYDWTCASFGPLESTTQMANRSVQPFLHILRQEVPILYNMRPCPPELPLPLTSWPPSNTIPWAHASLQSKRYLDRFSRFCADDRRVSLYSGLPVSSSKLPLPMGGSGPPCKSWFVGPTRVLNQTAAHRFSRFLQASLMWQTDRATDHATRSV